MDGRSSQLIREWERPVKNETTGKEKNFAYFYDDNAFGGFTATECVSFNVTGVQKWQLHLNGTLPISSFYLSLKPGGMYGGYTSVGQAKNLTIKPFTVVLGGTECPATKVYDYAQHSTHVIFQCDSLSTDYTSYSSGTDQIVILTDPNQFDKKFDPYNVSLCSLTIFHASESCGTPDRPLNSVVRIENQIAYYSCEAGYQLIGK